MVWKKDDIHNFFWGGTSPGLSKGEVNLRMREWALDLDNC